MAALCHTSWFPPIRFAHTPVVPGPGGNYITQIGLQELSVKVFLLLSCDGAISLCGWENATWGDGFVYSLAFGGKESNFQIANGLEGSPLLAQKTTA